MQTESDGGSALIAERLFIVSCGGLVGISRKKNLSAYLIALILNGKIQLPIFTRTLNDTNTTHNLN